ncbi:MAG: glutathione peroxidase [Bacillota bacterium]|nr:glutathione peroxidase [Bacillota bacterium]
MSIYDFNVTDIDGKEVSLAEYKDNVILIVNTATGCGFTPQYEGLEALYQKYKDQGFVILDFPCNQFFRQAPGSDSEIKSFCSLKYGVSFPQFHKIDVNGKTAHPLYVYLKECLPGRISWNFNKFLISRDGKVVSRFGSMVTPKKLEKEIETLL